MARKVLLLIAGGLLVILALVVARQAFTPRGPDLLLVSPAGTARTLSFAELNRMDEVEALGAYPLPSGRWEGEGVYEGVTLEDLVGDEEYSAVEIISATGESVSISRERIEDGSHRFVLALSLDGVEPPRWLDGPQIAILSEAGPVSSEAFGVPDVSTLWVRNVVEIRLLRGDGEPPSP
jgi:hypothetical protein